MKSESTAFCNCLRRASAAYQILVTEKDDCNLKIDAEIDLLATECKRIITKKEKAQIKKIAKAFAADNADSIKEEAEVLARIVGDFFEAPVRITDDE